MKKLISCLILLTILVMSPSCSDYNPSQFLENQVTSIEELVVPEGFDWTTTQSVTLALSSDVTTKVHLYSDSNCTKQLCSRILWANESAEVALEVPAATDRVFMSYIDNTGADKVVEVPFTSVTRASVSAQINDASELVNAQSSVQRDLLPDGNSSFGTIMFEDMYPETGDYDMNDVVLGYSIDHKIVGSIDDDYKEVVSIILQIRALGGGKSTRPGVQLLGVNLGEVLSIEYETTDPNLSATCLSKTDTDPLAFVINGCSSLKQGSDFYNVSKKIENEADLPKVKITINRSLPVGETSPLAKLDNYDFFLEESGKEIHLTGYSASKFATNAGESSFKDEYGLVWALRFPTLVPHSREGINLTQSFANFVSWVKYPSANSNWTDSYIDEKVIRYENSNISPSTGFTGVTVSSPYIRTVETSLAFSAAGGSKTIDVDANTEYDIIAPAGWVYDYRVETGKLTLYAQQNYNASSRSGNLTLVSTTDASVKVVIPVSQATEQVAGAVMISKQPFSDKIGNLAGGKDKIQKIIFKGHDTADPVDPYIKIGDGNNKVYASWDAATATITLTTPAEIIKSQNSCEKMFKQLTNLKEIDFSGGFDTSSSTSFKLMFNLCNSLESVDLQYLNSGSVTDMSEMFNGCTALKTVDLRPLDTKNVTTLWRLFYKCSSLETVQMGCETTSLADKNDPPCDNGSFCRVFEDCTSLKSVDLSRVDIHNAKDVRLLFGNCTSLEKVVFGDCLKNAVNLQQLFKGALAANFECTDANFANATSLENAFNCCPNIENINLSGWNIPKVEKLNSFFKPDKNLKYVNLDGWEVPSAKNMDAFLCLQKTGNIEKVVFGSKFIIPSGTVVSSFIQQNNSVIFVGSEEVEANFKERGVKGSPGVIVWERP